MGPVQQKAREVDHRCNRETGFPCAMALEKRGNWAWGTNAAVMHYPSRKS
jgi:hypothetical protein